MKQIFLLLAKRLKSKSPKLFNKIAIIAGIVGVVALTLPALPITLPVTITALLPLIASACGGITTVAMLTTEDKKLIKETNDIFKK